MIETLVFVPGEPLAPVPHAGPAIARRRLSQWCDLIATLAGIRLGSRGPLEGDLALDLEFCRAMHSGRGRGELPELARVVKGALLRTAWQKASQVTSTKLTEHRVQLGREGVRIRIRPVCGHNP